MSDNKLKRFFLTNQDSEKSAYAPIVIAGKTKAILNDIHKPLLQELRNRHQRLINAALSNTEPLSSYSNDSCVPVNCTGIQYTKPAFWLDKIRFLFRRGKLFGQFSVPGKNKVYNYIVQSVLCAPKFPNNTYCKGDFYICIECILLSLKQFRFEIKSNTCVRHRFNNHLFLLDAQSDINSKDVVTSSLFKNFNDNYNVTLEIKGSCVLKEAETIIGTYFMVGTKKSGKAFTSADFVCGVMSLDTISVESIVLFRGYNSVQPLDITEDVIDVTDDETEQLWPMDLSVKEPAFCRN